MVYSKSSYVRRRNQRRSQLFLYMEGKSCIDCGEDDIVVLQFDHVRGEKRYNISKMVNSMHPWKAIKREIAKCDIVCANCHQRRTAKQQGWYQGMQKVGANKTRKQ